MSRGRKVYKLGLKKIQNVFLLLLLCPSWFNVPQCNLKDRFHPAIRRCRPQNDPEPRSGSWHQSHPTRRWWPNPKKQKKLIETTKLSNFSLRFTVEDSYLRFSQADSEAELASFYLHIKQGSQTHGLPTSQKWTGL